MDARLLRRSSWYPPTLRAVILALAWTSLAAGAPTAAGPEENPVLTRDPATGAYAFSWWGRAGREA